jgi:glucose dehydrogenase
MSTGTLRGQEGQPLVVGNMMYFESSYPNYVYAVDLNQVGKIAWKFAPEQDKFSPSVACCDLVNKCVAYADGKILIATLDTHVYALDAKTGKVLWNAKNGDPQLGQTMTIAPLVVHDKVIVGISGGEYGVRGHLSAYDLNSGKLVWRANSVGPDQDILFNPDKTVDGATQRARIRVLRAGNRTSGNLVGARPGGSTHTIHSSIWFTTEAAIPGLGIHQSDLGITSGRRAFSRVILTPAQPHGYIR